MEEQKEAQEAQSELNFESILNQLTTRTMARDLATVAKKGPPAPAGLPLKKELPPPPRPSLPQFDQIFSQAQKAFDQAKYQVAIELAQNILQEKNASFLISFRANRLMKKSKKAQEKIAREQKLPPLMAKPVPPPPPPKPKIEAPPPKPAAPLAAVARETPRPPEKPSPKIAYPSPVSPVLPAFKLPGQVAKPKPERNLGLIFGSAAIIVLTIILGFLFWPKPQPEPEPTPPAPVFSMEKQEIIEIKAAEFSNLPSKIQALAQNTQPAGNFIHLVIKQVNGKTNYPDLDKVLSAFNINLPSLECPAQTTSTCPGTKRLADNIIPENYSLFFYYQKELPEHPLSPTRQPARLGLIVKLKDPAGAKEILAGAESKLADIFEPMLLGKTPVSFIKKFQDNLYQNVAIRYINFPDKYLSLDYAIWGDWLMMTTSKESAYATLDKIVSP